MKTPTLLPYVLTRKLIFLVALGLSFSLQAGTTWWDPDNTPSNNSTNGTGTGTYSSGATEPLGPIAWEAPYWTDDSNLPSSITSTLVNFNEGDDVIFWSSGAASATPTIALALTNSHTVNSLSFYGNVPSGSAACNNYELYPGTAGGFSTTSGSLTNTSGVINCDGGANAATSSENLNSSIGVTYYSTNGIQFTGKGTVKFLTNMVITGGNINLSAITRPGAAGGITLPSATNALQWNTNVNGAYQPWPLGSQISLTNGAILGLGASSPLTSSVPVSIWNGLITGSATATLTAPAVTVKSCRDGNNTWNSCPMLDYGLGGTNTVVTKTGSSYFQIATSNYYKGGTVVSQGFLQFTIASTTLSAVGTNTVTMGDSNTGSLDIGFARSSTAASSTTTNLFNNIVVTTNGTGRVFIGNQAMNSFMRFSGTLALGRSVILGGSGTAVNGAYVTTAGATFTNTISGVGGVTVQGASQVFPTSASDAANGYFSTSQSWFSGGTVQLTSGNNSYSGGSAVLWGTLEGTANGSLGSGNVTVTGPGVLKLDAPAVIASTANLIMGTNSSTPAGSNAAVNLNFSGTNTINALTLDGYTAATPGTWGAVGSTAANQNTNFIGTGILNVTNTMKSTTTTLASSANPAELNLPGGQGSNVTFTATVSAIGTPTGTVTFKTNNIAVATKTISGGVATLTTSLPAGTNSVTANYNGDGNFLQSTSSALSQVINQSLVLSTTNSITGITTSAGTSQLSFHGTPGAYYWVVTSPNLNTALTNWTVVPNSGILVTNVSGDWSLTVSNTSSAQYYSTVTYNTGYLPY